MFTFFSRLFYNPDDAFVSIHRGLFNTRSRSEHSRKRKIISNTFAQKSVLEFEPYIGESLRELLNKWDGLCKNAGSGGASGGKGDLKGYAVIDLLVWLNALAFELVLHSFLLFENQSFTNTLFLSNSLQCYR